MTCPDCGIEVGSLPCWRCEREALDREWEYKSLIKEFSLTRGAPENDADRASLERAVACIRKRLAKEKFRGDDVTYNPQYLLRSKTWWYIPYRWIGCFGFIVDIDDGYVNWLGSSLTVRLRQCFWGHERELFCDLVDFEFAPDTNKEFAAHLLSKFKHTNPNARGEIPQEPLWYEAYEIPSAMAKHFPIFKRHFVWFAIPALLEACEKRGLRFTCRLAES